MTYVFAVPIPPGKTEAVRDFVAELLGSRKAGYEDLARRSDVSEEHYWLQHDPSGDLLVVASDSDQTKYMAILANPETDFDRWMGAEIQRIFGSDPDAGPGPINEPLGVLRV
jgi:hypothetical protein